MGVLGFRARRLRPRSPPSVSLQGAPSPVRSGTGHKALVSFFVGTDDNVLHLTFYYLMNLNVMTVKAKVTTAVEMTTAISAG